MNLDSLLLEGDDRDEMKDVGSILAKVQGDLRHLREELQAQITRGDVVDIQSLQRTIEHIEERLTDQTEQIVKKKFGNFTTLPIVLPQHQPQPQRHIVKHSKALSTPNPIPLVTSPGQEAQLQYMSKLLAQPTHPSTRQILNDAFGIPYSVRHSPRKGRQLRKRAMSGGTVNHLTVLPLINRRSALMTPPPISSTDAQYGLLSLLERGLIPKAADIQLHPSPVHHRTAALHSFSTHKLKSFPIDNLEGGGAFVGVKLDINTVITDKKPQLPPIPFNDQRTTSVTKPVIKTLNVPNVTTEHQEDQQLLSIQKQHKDYKIPIRGGLILHNDLEYKEFKTKHKGIWYKVQRILDCVEQMAQNYAIPVVFVSGDKLLELVEEYDLEPNPRNKELLPCILNSKEVEHLLRIPGRRFKGHNGVRVAATKLQATYRMYVQRCQYLEYRRMKWAAGVIAMGWTLHMKVSKVKKLLKEDRENHVINYRERLKILGESWQNYSQQKRVIIHIPSKGYLCHIRKGLPQFSLSQNLQMSRVCDAIDPNVDIVYVCPVEIGDEVKDYYQQLLDMREKNTDIWNRVHFIVPEHLESFGHHRLSLASLLKYSPQALRQIKSIIGDRQAIIVPHVPSHEDLEIADLLDVPLLGAEPSLIRLYSTYSGRQQLFLAAEVTTPPHIKGVYSVEQLIDGLSWLVVNFISVRRWLFKIDHHVHGRGIAYCDVHDHLDCYKWILKERNRYGEKWDKQWAQEHAIKRVLFELPAILARNAIPTDKQAFSTWASFQKEFLASGGSIEAHPPSDSVTSITVDLLLGPDQSYSTLSTWDHIHSGAYQVWGGSMPQTSVEPDVLMSLAEKVAEAALSRGIVGHISVDFVTFIHPDDMSQTIWGVDLDFGPSDYVYMHSLLRTVANLQLDWSSGQSIGSQQRYAIVSTQLKHSNLSLVEYGVFFQMCKAHLIGYNNKTCTGTLFTLIESHHRHNLGMICLQTSLSEALATAADALSAIHQEISTPHMQGSSNFPAVSQSMNEIAQLLQANIDETS